MSAISLYIDGKRADLADDGLILFNYQAEDLQNPTIVKNTYSQSITLEGTPANNAIFSYSFRTDRRIDDNGFQPLRKTPFVIYNDKSEVLESGYVKLESVERNGSNVRYKVSLFGGLGSFLYSLTYDAEGNKRSLADLEYLNTNNSETELDFNINAQAVRDAWQMLLDDTQTESKWKVINFAPCYNGIPEGNFNADKGILTPSSVGLDDSYFGDDGEYSTKQGKAIVNLSKEHHEWEVKDLRSYLQRPVVSMREIFKAIANPANNGGYEVDWSEIDSNTFFRLKNIWMTLPMFPSLNPTKRMGNVSFYLTSNPTTSGNIGTYTIGASLASGTLVSATMSMKHRYNIPSATAETLTASKVEVQTERDIAESIVAFYQAIGFGSNGSALVGSAVYPFVGEQLLHVGGEDLANLCGYVPTMTGVEMRPTMQLPNLVKAGSGIYESAEDFSFDIEGYDIKTIGINVKYYKVTSIMPMEGEPTYEVSSINLPSYYEGLNSYQAISQYALQGSVGNTLRYESPDSLRSGSLVTKQTLLSNTETPADYLLSFCKMWGFYLRCYPADKRVVICSRNSLYQDKILDLTKRINKGEPISITPYLLKSKWYDFHQEGVGAGYEKEYQSIYGFPYGRMRINTGYDFNADAQDVLKGSAFKSAISRLDAGRYYNIIEENSKQIPSVFLDNGNTYTLWSADGKSTDIPIPTPTYSANIRYLNEFGHEGFDVEFCIKTDFRDASGKGVDGEGVLLFFNGFFDYEGFKISDDNATMNTLNEGVPCWDLDPVTNFLPVPVFARYGFYDNWHIEASLDFGKPQEVAIPYARYDDCTIYSKMWQKYLADRYDENTKVMRCKVDLRGFMVGLDLLRYFYYYDGSLWVLNKITNHSLTTNGDTECEFIQVQDKDNYINGQR